MELSASFSNQIDSDDDHSDFERDSDADRGSLLKSDSRRRPSDYNDAAVAAPLFEVRLLVSFQDEDVLFSPELDASGGGLKQQVLINFWFFSRACVWYPSLLSPITTTLPFLTLRLAIFWTDGDLIERNMFPWILCELFG